MREGPLPEYTHLAFSISPGSFEGMSDYVVVAGVELWQDNHTPGGSRHKLEIHASDLSGRIVADRRDPPPGMVFFD